MMYLSNLLFTLLGVVLGWIPQVYSWGRDRFTSTKAPWITFRVREPHRPPPGATYLCKILVDITNQLPGQSVRLAAAYFVFAKSSPLRPDPMWSREYKTKRFHLRFVSSKTKQHDWRDVYLRTGETNNTFIGVDPQHSDEDIKQAIRAENVGRLYFQMTRWTDSGRPKTRWVRVKI